jgi:hypothetical protein
VLLLLAGYKKFIETHHSLINVGGGGGDILEEIVVNGRIFIRVRVREMYYQAH